MKLCPECQTEVPPAAAVCAHCTRRIVGKRCPECAEMAAPEASKCPFCSHNFARHERIATVESLSVTAALLPTIFLRGRFIPQEMHLTPEKILIQTHGFFWLSRTDEEIPWEKIAGYHYHSGWFWDSVEIQTRGQKANQMTCLPKDQGQKIKETLERMKE
jgi:hypothetical protein